MSITRRPGDIQLKPWRCLPGSPEAYGRTSRPTEKWAKVVQFAGAHVN